MKRPQREVFTLWVDRDLMVGLRKLQERSGIALAEAMRRAIRAYLHAEGITPRRHAKRAARKRAPKRS